MKGFDNGLVDDDKKVAFFEKHTQFKTKIDTLYSWLKRLKSPYPFGAAHSDGLVPGVEGGMVTGEIEPRIRQYTILQLPA